MHCLKTKAGELKLIFLSSDTILLTILSPDRSFKSWTEHLDDYDVVNDGTSPENPGLHYSFFDALKSGMFS